MVLACSVGEELLLLWTLLRRDLEIGSSGVCCRDRLRRRLAMDCSVGDSLVGLRLRGVSVDGFRMEPVIMQSLSLVEGLVVSGEVG